MHGQGTQSRCRAGSTSAQTCSVHAPGRPRARVSVTGADPEGGVLPPPGRRTRRGSAAVGREGGCHGLVDPVVLGAGRLAMPPEHLELVVDGLRASPKMSHPCAYWATSAASSSPPSPDQDRRVRPGQGRRHAAVSASWRSGPRTAPCRRPHLQTDPQRLLEPLEALGGGGEGHAEPGVSRVPAGADAERPARRRARRGS